MNGVHEADVELEAGRVVRVGTQSDLHRGRSRRPAAIPMPENNNFARPCKRFPAPELRRGLASCDSLAQSLLADAQQAGEIRRVQDRRRAKVTSDQRAQ